MARKQSKKLSDQLRQAIAESGVTRYRISQATGVSEAVLSRFMNSKVGLSMATVDTICEYLELELVARQKSKAKKGE